MNRTIVGLMVSDVFIFTGFGLVDPILAIFIKDHIAGGTIIAAGLASTIFFVVKSLVQLPFSRYVDTHDNKLKWLLVGTILTTAIPFLYLTANSIWMIYWIQVVHGIASGLAYPTWLGLWTAHMDRHHESFEWSLYSTLVGIGVGITATVGAAIAQNFGFSMTFILVGAMLLFGCAVLFLLENERERKYTVTSEHFHRRRSAVKH